MTEPASKTNISATPAKADAQLGKINPKLIETVSVTLEAYLGEARMTVAELTALKDSSVVPLDAALNQSVELRLNGLAVARGELVAVGDSFAVRLTEIAK
ncbi:MAG TPA: FliM/FliN family flagellar motor switch protein [Allosphingosinicella sp.]